LFLGALTGSSWPLMIKPIAEVRTLPDESDIKSGVR
jgi:hypothetical protein